ncbi:MAG: type VI secretion system protein TssL [Gammaproteobacteria bacterium]|nr:type VI secretion system protein TssL [Gammaproteobacteria bacterium]
MNPLTVAASPLLSLLSKLRNTPHHQDVTGLRSHMEQEIHNFENRARSENVDRETIHEASYCLCTVVDETVLNTPWGNESTWKNQSLLIQFHREAWGGQKFFDILQHKLQEPNRHIDLLELMYICMSMGFEGKFRVIDDGLRTLEQLRDSTYRAIRRQRGEFERNLSPHWRSEESTSHTLRYHIPLWVVAAFASALLLSTYLIFSYFINQASIPVFKELYTIGREEPPTEVARITQPASSPQPATKTIEEDIPPPPVQISTYKHLSGFLEPEIQQKLVELIDGERSIIIRLRNKGLFGSGSDKVSATFKPLLKRIAEALATTDEQIVVAGHSDNVPIHTLRFPSNWHLSIARAQAVADILESSATIPGEITADGRADNEPLVPNDTPQNRARNRRVEVILEK